ncbi:MAG: hypothetical protein Q8O07_06760, partial [Chloroflexota bacterium]|nr:hypothetical protein [Chloroflexota bacterium]
ANEGADTLGAVGYVQDEASRNVRIIELIAQDDAVKGSLLRRAVDQAEQVHEAEAIDCEVSAYSPRIQRTLLDLGFLPAAYIPGMVFHGTARWDIVKMMKLNVAWDLGPMQLVDSARQMFDVVTPAFVRADSQRSRMRQVAGAGVLSGLTPLESDFVQAAGEELAPEAGALIPADTLHLILEGSVTAGSRSLGPKECFGAAALLGQGAEAPAVAGPGVRLLRLTPAGLDALSDRHPRLGLRLYRNLAACAKRDDGPAPPPDTGPGGAATSRPGA